MNAPDASLAAGIGLCGYAYADVWGAGVALVVGAFVVAGFAVIGSGGKSRQAKTPENDPRGKG